jgi:hypothetical protein
MINQYLTNQFQNERNIRFPLDVVRLANRFWHNDINKTTENFPIWTFKKGDLNAITIEGKGDYYLLKVTHISKPKQPEPVMKNKYVWFTDDPNDAQKVEIYFNNDEQSFVNADGTPSYNNPGKAAAIFGIKTDTSVPNFGIFHSLPDHYLIKAILYQGQLLDKDNHNSAFDENTAADIHIFFTIDYIPNIAIPAILRPWYWLIKKINPNKQKPAGGPSSAGVRIPPRNMS